MDSFGLRALPLAFIDVETTGLAPGWHEMIDIGVVMAELDGSELEALHLRIQPAHPVRISDGARRVNAFDADLQAQRAHLSRSGSSSRWRTHLFCNRIIK